jgi:hypothetical protein
LLTTRLQRLNLSVALRKLIPKLKAFPKSIPSGGFKNIVIGNCSARKTEAAVGNRILSLTCLCQRSFAEAQSHSENAQLLYDPSAIATPSTASVKTPAQEQRLS